MPQRHTSLRNTAAKHIWLVAGRVCFCASAAIISAFLLGGPPAWAQTQTDDTATTVPQTTTATYRDWTLRCDNAVDTPPRTVCEVAQMVAGPDNKTPLAQVVIGKLGPDAPFRLIVQLPSGVWLPSHALLVVDDEITVTATFKRCVQLCFADTDLDEAAIAALRARTEPVRLLFADGNQRIVERPVSVSGLSAALDAGLNATEVK